MNYWLRLQKLSYVLLPLTLAPGILYGGWFNDVFGLGKGAEAAAKTAQNITFATLGYKFLDEWMPHLYVLLLVGCAVWCLQAAREPMERFTAVYLDAKKDEAITRSETFWLIAQYLPHLACTIALLWFGGLFGYMSSTAILDTVGAIK